MASESGVCASSIAVCTPSGHTACTRTDFGVSASTDIVSETTAALVAAYTLRSGTGPSPDSDAVLTMSPPCSPNASIAARIPQIVPSRLTSTWRRVISSGMSASRPSWQMPALLNHAMSTPWRAAAAATSRCDPGSRMSCAIPSAAPISAAVAAAASPSTSVSTTR